MTGLFFLLVAALWFALLVALAYVMTSRIGDVILRFVVALVAVAVLLPLPLVDEFIGKRQFEQLCKENSKIQVDRTTAVGKRVYLITTPDVDIRGKWLRMVLKPWRFVDVTTGDSVVTYNTLMADGGWLVQHLGISEGGVPLTFRSSCEASGLVDPVKLFKDLGITQIHRSALNLKEQK